MESITYPDGSTETFETNENGDLDAQFNRRGEEIDIEFDDDGRFERYDLPDNSSLAYQYDTRGNIVQIEATDGVTLLQYDDLMNPDLPTRISYPDGRVIDYMYQDGRRTSMVTDSGFALKYAYDSAGRVAQVDDANDDLIVSYQYDSVGRLDRTDKGNGTFTQYGYDNAGQLQQIVNRASDGKVLSRFDYVHDTLGRRTEMAMLDGTWTFAYDAVGQLTRAELVSDTLPNQSLQYAYNATGNVVQANLNGTVLDFDINDLDQIVAVDGDSFTYDADGNLINRTSDTGSETFSYDALNHLLGRTNTSGEIEYDYGAFGQRTATVVDDQRTEFLVDPTGLGNLVAQYDDAGTLLANYAYGLQLVSQTDASGDDFFYDANGVGSIVGVSDASMAYVNQYSYLPYGELLSSSEAIVNPFQFNGAFGVMNEVDGLHYMRNRFYASDLGVFTSVDPLRLREPNYYRFADNDPIRFVDPLGLAPCGSDPTAGDLGGAFVESVAVSLSDKFVPIVTIPGGCAKEVGNGLQAIKRMTEGKSPYLNADRFSKFLPGGSPGDSGTVGIRRAKDPNEKTGANGFGDSRHILPDTVIPYRVDFENLESATAPAQRVTITDQLDDNLNWGTLQFTQAGFGDYRIEVPAGSQHFETTIDVVVEGENFDVAVTLDLDVTTGMVTAVFQSLQTDSELPPVDVLTGLLPPEDGTGRGQGFFAYTISPEADLPSGTEIRNIALITFDVNEVIATNQIDPLDPSKGTDPTNEALNTIDSASPTSAVLELPEAIGTETFSVEWAGTDETQGSGISGYDLFVSADGGPFEQVLSRTPDTSFEFTGVSGVTYGFASVAHDNVGHVESIPTEPDTEILVIVGAWVNRANVYDVNGSGDVTPADLVAVLDQLAEKFVFDRETEVLIPVPPPGFAPPYYDVSGDGLLSPDDALRVINELARLGDPTNRPQSEGLEAGPRSQSDFLSQFDANDIGLECEDGLSFHPNDEANEISRSDLLVKRFQSTDRYFEKPITEDSDDSSRRPSATDILDEEIEKLRVSLS